MPDMAMTINPLSNAGDNAIQARPTDVQASYDLVTAEYVRRIFDELRHKPLDYQLLDRFAASVGSERAVCDMGCGPGHVARYLHERGAKVCGVDLSTAMIAETRLLNPGIVFHQGDLLKLDFCDSTWAGVAAFYSLIHIPRGEMVAALRELRRVLCPGGLLLTAFHLGDQTLHLDEWWGYAVSVDFHFFQAAEMQSWLQEAGFEIVEIIERDPYPGVEHASRRAYIFARSVPP